MANRAQQLELPWGEQKQTRRAPRVTMLLGPAGTGKTFRCVDEVHRELAARPEGSPLIFLAPRQSTFQLERVLLSDGLAGYSRLRILSFQRLAAYVFDALRQPSPRLLTEEGRVMVLRALLGGMHQQFAIFGTSARRLGFAEEASAQIREFQQQGLTPDQLRRVAVEIADPARQKLLDLALLYDRYNQWLAANDLKDEDALLTLAADLLELNPGKMGVGGVWFDGFAQLTPQERRLLGALLGQTERACLAFCMDRDGRGAFSPWAMVAQTVDRCRLQLESLFGKSAIQIEWLERRSDRGRFTQSTALAHLERCWAGPQPFGEVPRGVRVVECPDPENEVIACAREILRVVRAGGRFREVAVLLRAFDNDYPHLVRRVFARYGIPFFLDHRETVAHHPVAELIRGAQRIILFNWKHHDCFSVFKTGLFGIAPEYLDELENHALEHGWEGSDWRDGFQMRKNVHREEVVNHWRERLAAPFLQFAASLPERPSGPELTGAIRALWTELNVEAQLEEWTREAGDPVHETVWEQMNVWIENIDLAFAQQRMPLRDWLPIVEAGLQGLTVGVIPPVLDQVLVGTVDRSRNPDLKVIFVLGLNEGVFPAIPAHRPLLTERDRDALLAAGVELANVPAFQVPQEQFYGYIACTRARESVVLSYARASSDGKALNPSRFIGQIQRLFPHLEVEHAAKPRTLSEVEHVSELRSIESLPPALGGHRAIFAPDPEDGLDPALARRLYGRELKVSVSAMERFASCPFRFFVDRGLRVRERSEFNLDIREQGSFQHQVLSRFHEEVRKSGRKWRDLSVTEARDLIGAVADEEMRTFQGGLLTANEQNRFTGENYKAALQDFIATIIGWFKTNAFDPEAVELPFGPGETLPGWRVPLENDCELVLEGRIDRVDLVRRPDGSAGCVVCDYKSGAQKPDPLLLKHGIQQQLPAYLLALIGSPQAAAHFGVERLEPGGCFYVPLTARYENAPTRAGVIENIEASKREAYTHSGIFNHQYLADFDSTFASDNSRQFAYRLNKEGLPQAKPFAALTPQNFKAVLQRVEENARSFGVRIYSGDIAIRPYKKGRMTACGRCRYQSICRFDPSVQKHNSLRPEA